MAAVREAVEALRPSPYMHISVRRRMHPGIDYLGGGFPESVLRRFGELEVERSEIIDGILCLYVI